MVGMVLSVALFVTLFVIFFLINLVFMIVFMIVLVVVTFINNFIRGWDYNVVFLVFVVWIVNSMPKSTTREQNKKQTKCYNLFHNETSITY